MTVIYKIGLGCRDAQAGSLEGSEGGAHEKLVVLYIINSLTECTIIS